MVSLIAASSSARFTVCQVPFLYLKPSRLSPIVLVISPPKQQCRLRPKRKQLKQNSQKRMCKRWEGEADPALELEVLEFMKNSNNPETFPSKRDLLEAGRVDLIEAIARNGGWMSMGWDYEDEGEITEDCLARNWEFDFEKYGQNDGEGQGSSGSELNESKNIEGTSFLGNSSPAASSSGRSLEKAAEEDSGIEGILNRLERQRNISFGLKFGENGSTNCSSGNLGVDDKSAGLLKGCGRHAERTQPAPLRHNGAVFSDHGLNRSYSSVLSSSMKEDTWRTWSIERAGFSDVEFEAAEIDYGGNMDARTADSSMGEILAVTTDIKGLLDKAKDLNSCDKEFIQSDLKARLQHLEQELSSALSLLRSNITDLFVEGKEHLSEGLRQLSDASEFQENEIMNAQDKLRSIRAKLVVLEGKMELAIIDSQKILDEKQKRIDNARKALQLLRTACIVWPNSGSEVLLAGSFDGWATQRKMERSSSGVFSLSLKLYPGKYEIKFIVDGSWRVDPLRPIVNNDGFENNLLIIT